MTYGQGKAHRIDWQNALHWEETPEGIETLGKFGTVERIDGYWVARARDRVIGVYLWVSEAEEAVENAAIEDGHLLSR